MNILTKICVVVLLVLVLFSSGVFISSAVTPDNWRMNYLNQLARAEQAVTLALNTQLALRQEQLNRDAISKELQAVRSDSVKQVGTLSADLATANTDLKKKDADLSAANADLKKSLANLEMAMGVTKIKDAQLTEASKLLATANADNQRLNSTVNQLTSEADRYVSKNKSLAEMNQMQKEYITQLLEQKAQPAPAAGTGTATTVTPSGETPKVDGQVTAVSGDIVSVNIGSSKGLKVGMTLIVYRNVPSGVELVGKLTIKPEGLDLSETSGVITGRKGEVKQGDLVTTNVPNVK